jgi:hypothetical protein
VNRHASVCTVLGSFLAVVACSGDVLPVALNGANPDGGRDGSFSEGEDSSSPGGCVGTAPACFGTELQSCCAEDPSGVATCEGIYWMCGSVGAPGCSGESCPPTGPGPADASASCIGTPPNCFGNDFTSCCGQDPVAIATCSCAPNPAGQACTAHWMCGAVAAPGCNGAPCSQPPDGGGPKDSSPSGCVGTTPDCFGTDPSACCGKDPLTVATCNGTVWMCGSAAAPGCNGTTCATP